jgi:hypothetical protein
MSLLGPDDYNLNEKGRKKKLAKDLSPSVAEEIEKWLDKLDTPLAFKKIAELVGEEEAKQLIGERYRHGRRLKPGDPWLRE